MSPVMPTPRAVAAGGRPAGDLGPTRLDLLTSPLFLISLVTLVANDHIFKKLAPGILTGKLSDMAGVFAFTLFWCALLPNYRTAAGFVIGGAFAAWKLPLSSPAIDFWNTHAPFAIGRTIDPTDLISLVVVPVAVAYVAWRQETYQRRPAVIVVAIASILAFGATSYRTTFEYDTEFSYAGAPSDFLTEIQKRGIRVYSETVTAAAGPVEYWFGIPSTICFDTIDAYVLVTPRGPTTNIRLVRLTHRCPRRGDDKALLYGAFRAAIVEPLRLNAA